MRSYIFTDLVVFEHLLLCVVAFPLRNSFHINRWKISNVTFIIIIIIIISGIIVIIRCAIIVVLVILVIIIIYYYYVFDMFPMDYIEYSFVADNESFLVFARLSCILNKHLFIYIYVCVCL